MTRTNQQPTRNSRRRETIAHAASCLTAAASIPLALKAGYNLPEALLTAGSTFNATQALASRFLSQPSTKTSKEPDPEELAQSQHRGPTE